MPDHASLQPVAEKAQRSLFGEILDWMLAPLLLLWPASIVVTYLVAKSIANQPYDRILEDDVLLLAQQVREIDGKPVSQISLQSRDFLRADDLDTLSYQIQTADGVLLDGERGLPLPEDEPVASGNIHMRNATLHGIDVRIAYSYINLNRSKQGTHDLVLVQVAETLEKRAHLANEIIKGVILPQFVILPVALALIWFALARGLSPLAELQRRIRARSSDDLSPIDSRQVPEEISPLVASLNDLLERLAQTLITQKRFIADAAHQMKTPLAGMRTQAELALRLSEPEEIQRSLTQLAKSSETTTRLVNQLLALARTENVVGTMNPLEMIALTRDTVQEWIAAALARKIDLGFESNCAALDIHGNAWMLREMLNNLIDNALRYSNKGGTVTVRVLNDDAWAVLEVEDDGPGIPQTEREHVFERFYRILGNNAAGSGLGLAIVREIVQQHNGKIDIVQRESPLRPPSPGCIFRIRLPK